MTANAARAATPGETDLARLLAGLSPVLAPRPRAIRTQTFDAPTDAIMLFREEEGLTVVVEDDTAEPAWAQITLRVHSSLEAVGMIAAISAALARCGIPCNTVSAYYHDHVFVPWARRFDALDALRTLAAETQA